MQFLNVEFFILQMYSDWIHEFCVHCACSVLLDPCKFIYKEHLFTSRCKDSYKVLLSFVM